MPQRYLTTLLLGLLLITAAIVAHASHQRSWLEPNDDQLYLAALASRFSDPARFDTIVEDFSAVVRERGDTPIRGVRYDLRYNYKNNYAGASYVNQLVFNALGETTLRDSSFAHRTALAASITSMLLSSAALLVLLFALALARDQRLLATVAIVGVITVLEGFINVGAGLRLIDAEPGVFPNPFDIAIRTARLLIDPGNSTFLFGAGPRSAFVLLLLTTFILRWQGRIALAYWLFLPMAFLHQSYAGLFLVIVTGLDVLQRPRALLAPRVMLPIAAAVTIFVVRERLWDVVGAKGPITLLLLLTLAACAALIIRFWLPDFHARGTELWQRMQSALQPLHPSAADAILLIVGWIGFLLLTIIGNYFATPEQSMFFWGHSAGRILAAARPALLVALIYAILGRMQQPSQQHLVIPAALLMLVILLPAAVLRWPPSTIVGVIDRNTAALKDMDVRLTQPVAVIKGQYEPLIYYGIAKSVINGRDELSALRSPP